MSAGAIATFRAVRDLLTPLMSFTSSGDNAMRWSEMRGEFVSCPTSEPTATRFSLFGAVWRSLPAKTEDGKKMQYAAFMKLMMAAFKHRGEDFGPTRDATGGAYNSLDAWQKRNPTHKATLAMLDMVIESLTEIASEQGGTQ